MSYDVAVSCHTCGSALNRQTNIFSGIPQGIMAELGCPLLDWDGKTGVEVLPALQSAVTRLSEADLHDIRRLQDKFNSRTGIPHEDYDKVLLVAREFLTDMRDAICREPMAVIHVS